MRYALVGLAVFVMVTCRSPVSLDASEIPLGVSGGVFTVPVQVNRSITMQFLVDPEHRWWFCRCPSSVT